MPIQMWVQIAAARLSVEELPVPLIYNDPTRHFGGLLDDPDVRFDHYLSVLDVELAAQRLVVAPTKSSCVPCP
jgi:dolichol-phosphate mannosyltransferase